MLSAGVANTESGALSGEQGTGLDLASTTGSCSIKAFVSGHDDGGILRGTGHHIDCKFTDNSSDAIVLDGCGWCTIRGVGSGNANAVNVISETGPNDVRGIFNVGAGATLKSGAAWNTRSAVLLTGNGASGNFAEQQFADRSIVAGGWSPDVPTSNGTMLRNRGRSADVRRDRQYRRVARPALQDRGDEHQRFHHRQPDESGGEGDHLRHPQLVRRRDGRDHLGVQYKPAGAFTNPASTKRARSRSTGTGPTGSRGAGRRQTSNGALRAKRGASSAASGWPGTRARPRTPRSACCATGR